jgi:hypothetical protein
MVRGGLFANFKTSILIIKRHFSLIKPFHAESSSNTSSSNINEK